MSDNRFLPVEKRAPADDYGADDYDYAEEAADDQLLGAAHAAGRKPARGALCIAS